MHVYVYCLLTIVTINYVSLYILVFKDAISITPSLICNMMSQQSNIKVPVLPVLLCFVGHSDSGQEIALEQLLNLKEADVPINPATFTSHHVLATDLLKQPRYTYVSVPVEFYMFGVQSGFNRRVHVPIYDAIAPYPSVFQNTLLDSHMSNVLFHLKKFSDSDHKLISKSSDFEWIQKVISSLAKGAGLIKIWNMPLECNVFHFLRSFSGCLYNNHMWLFAHLKNTLEQFRKWQPPSTKFQSTDDEEVKLWYSNLDYLLRSSRVCFSSCAANSRKVCQIFASSKSEEKVEELLPELVKEVKFATAKLRVDHVIKEDVVHVDLRKNQYSKFDNGLRDIITANQQKIPLSWLFLRGALEGHSSIFMEKSHLKSIVSSCEIEGEDFAEFCKFFTSFGSIFDLSLVNASSKIVIIKPDEFLSALHRCFDDNPHESVKSNGIITHQIASELLGNDGLNFMRCLSDVGLVCTVPEGQFGDGCQQECFFMPCARRTKQRHSINEKAICLFISNLLPPTFTIFEVAFAKHLLRKLPNARLQPSVYENVTVIKYDNDTINITISGTYKGNCIEIMVSEESSVQHNTHCVIAEVVKGIAKEKSNKLGKVTYQFAAVCVNKKHHHILPDDKQCFKCSSDERKRVMLEKWSAAIEKVSIHKYHNAVIIIIITIGTL